jgi:hypothetical protein
MNPVAGCHQLQTVMTGIKRVKGTAAAYKLPFSPSHLTAFKSHLNLTCVVDAWFFAIIKQTNKLRSVPFIHSVVLPGFFLCFPTVC